MEEKLNVLIISILIIGLTFLVMATVSLLLNNYSSSLDNYVFYSSTQSILSNNGTSTTLSPIGEGITSYSVTTQNLTYISLDGTNDVVSFDVGEAINSTSIWFKNSTTEWTNIINSSGTIYINNVEDATWSFFPYYIEGNEMFLGKTDSSTFVDVDIDEVRTYNQSLDIYNINTIYNEGHYYE